MLPTYLDFPDKLVIGGVYYKIVFCKTIPDSDDALGLCDDAAKKIYLKRGQSHTETLSTLLHEAIHAIEREYDVPLRHAQVHKLERGLFDLLIANLGLFLK